MMKATAKCKIIGMIDLQSNKIDLEHSSLQANTKPLNYKSAPKRKKKYVQKPLTVTMASILAPALREYRNANSV